VKTACHLSVSTPYTAAHPLRDVLLLDPSGGSFTGTAAFNSITVRDTRPTGRPWTLKVLASALNSGAGTISGENVGLTGLTTIGHGGGFSLAKKNLTLINHPAASPPVQASDPGSRGLGGSRGHTIAHALRGKGSVVIAGTLQIVAPTSTPAGSFVGSITFAVGCGKVVVPIKPPTHPKHHHHHHHHKKPHHPLLGHKPPINPGTGVLGEGGHRGSTPTGHGHGTSPFTGLDAIPLFAAAAIALSTGVMLLIAARRRRPRRIGRHRMISPPTG
jgi:hypothetical protein